MQTLITISFSIHQDINNIVKVGEGSSGSSALPVLTHHMIVARFRKGVVQAAQKISKDYLISVNSSPSNISTTINASATAFLLD